MTANHDFHDDVEILYDGFAPVVHVPKMEDDEDAASVGSSDTGMKPLPQADEYGHLETLPSKDSDKKVNFLLFSLSLTNVLAEC
jgi:hypothetical protein